jgi:hypothetical protein
MKYVVYENFPNVTNRTVAYLRYLNIDFDTKLAGNFIVCVILIEILYNLLFRCLIVDNGDGTQAVLR